MLAVEAAQQTKAGDHPEAVFESPQHLAATSALTPRQRIVQLDRWEQTVLDRVAATSEGMPANDQSNEDTAILDQIAVARRRLRSGRW